MATFTAIPEAEMDSDWGGIAVNTAYLAADIAMIGENNNNEKNNPKYIRERKNRQKKKQSQDSQDDGGMQMNM